MKIDPANRCDNCGSQLDPELPSVLTVADVGDQKFHYCSIACRSAKWMGAETWPTVGVVHVEESFNSRRNTPVMPAKDQAAQLIEDFLSVPRRKTFSDAFMYCKNSREDLIERIERLVEDARLAERKDAVYYLKTHGLILAANALAKYHQKK